MNEPDALAGEYGTARRIPHEKYAQANPAALDGWIITAPCWHPHWSQYRLGIVSLAAFPGLPPAKLQRPDVTHELTVTALDPRHGPYDALDLPADGLHYLTPVNVGEQFTTTDEEARRLGFLCAKAVVDGLLIPETGDAPERLRAAWRWTIRRTLQHPDHTPGT